MSKYRKNLKAALVAKDGHIFQSAKKLEIHYNRLSGYISGRQDPPEEIIKKIENYLGKNRSKLGF